MVIIRAVCQTQKQSVYENRKLRLGLLMRPHGAPAIRQELQTINYGGRVVEQIYGQSKRPDVDLHFAILSFVLAQTNGHAANSLLLAIHLKATAVLEVGGGYFN